jgi:diketogulonate reductase-like aldo/keto reductase
MEFKELGKTGVMLPEIGIGTWQYNGGREPILKALSLGACLIDTAEMYGTEETVGEAARGERSRAFIATKVSGNHLRYDEVIKAAEASLKRLGTNCIDLYQIHWPDPAAPIKETMRAMETLVDEGKVRFIGVSNFYVRNLEEAQAAMSRYKIVSNQVKYSLLQRGIEEDTLSYCQQNGITILAYSPLDKGLLLARPTSRNKAAIAVLQKVALESGKTLAQVALNWCISKPNVIAIPKSNRAERVEENCGASGWRLSPRQMDALNRGFR